jgi:hypothetical protein
MDYLDNPLPGSIPAGADSRAAKKVRISTGVHNADAAAVLKEFEDGDDNVRGVLN